MIGSLSSEIPNIWTLRIPSHISPRYMTNLDLLKKRFEYKLKKNADEELTKWYTLTTV